MRSVCGHRQEGGEQAQNGPSFPLPSISGLGESELFSAIPISHPTFSTTARGWALEAKQWVNTPGFQTHKPLATPCPR